MCSRLPGSSTEPRTPWTWWAGTADPCSECLKVRKLATNRPTRTRCPETPTSPTGKLRQAWGGGVGCTGLWPERAPGMTRPPTPRAASPGSPSSTECSRFCRGWTGPASLLSCFSTNHLRPQTRKGQVRPVSSLQGRWSLPLPAPGLHAAALASPNPQSANGVDTAGRAPRTSSPRRRTHPARASGTPRSTRPASVPRAPGHTASCPRRPEG